MDKPPTLKEATTTDFGYQQVKIAEKSAKVADVFHSVASRYDVMNDLMSFGIHRYWKRFTLGVSGIKSGQRVLDLAAGTGDLALQIAKAVGSNGEVFLVDINESMLKIGQERLINRGLLHNIYPVQADAESLPFHDNYFDCITIAFGLRNVTDKRTALASMLRTLKPGGRLLVLEFSTPVLPTLQQLYDLFSFNVLPKLGQWVTGNAQNYQYLVESIRMHPNQETLKSMIQEAGFDSCEYHNLTGGIVALHKGYKY